jgi:hypothetical protein
MCLTKISYVHDVLSIQAGQISGLNDLSWVIVGKMAMQ